MKKFNYAWVIAFILLAVLGAAYLTTERTRAPKEVAVLPATKDDLIVVNFPLPNSTVTNPMTISGEARGGWYFEAQFPVKIYDANGKLLGDTAATAEGEWMTENYVPFKAAINFTAPSTETGVLVLEKDNPSGLPEHANELSIPVRFAAQENVSAVGTKVKLYFYDPKLDQGPGGAQCSRNGLVAVFRVIPKTSTPLTDTIKLLLRGALTQGEKDRGITTEFPLRGVTLEKATITNGIATLTFSDPENRTGGGSCRVGILWFQIEATAKQFPSVQSVRFMPEELFQP